MTASPRPRARRVSLACLLVAALVATPASAWFPRPKIHFQATFNLSGSPGNPLPQADVGEFSQDGPDDVFEVVPAPIQGGELKISGAIGSTDAVLIGDFKKKFTGQHMRFEMQVRASQSTTALSVRLVDDSDTGMIDAIFGGDGQVRVGGQTVMPYEPDTNYNATIDLYDPLFGAEFWVATFTTGDGSVWQESGPLLLSKPLTIGSVEIIRPAGSADGEFHIDNVRALSYKLPSAF